jgi:hypothetical protein
VGGKMTLMQLKSMLTHWGRRLTWQWLVSFALLAACIGFYLSVVMPTRHTLEEAKAKFVVMKHEEQNLKQASQNTARQAPTGRLEMFYQEFPSEDSVPDTIGQIISFSQEKGLNPKQAEYRIVRNNPGELLSYQITLPIKGAYPKITAFAYELLTKVPNLSLDNISFQRQKIGDNDVEAMLWMTLYIKRGHSNEH